MNTPETGLTHKEFAELLGIANETLRRYRKGERTPPARYFDFELTDSGWIRRVK